MTAAAIALAVMGLSGPPAPSLQVRDCLAPKHKTSQRKRRKQRRQRRK